MNEDLLNRLEGLDFYAALDWDDKDIWISADEPCTHPDDLLWPQFHDDIRKLKQAKIRYEVDETPSFDFNAYRIYIKA